MRAPGAVLRGCEEQLEAKVAEDSLDPSERKTKKIIKKIIDH